MRHPCLTTDSSAILLADDDTNDFLLLRYAFREARLINPLHLAPNAEAVIAYLAGEGPYADHTPHLLPALLLIDMKMLQENRFEVLKWIRQQPVLRMLRVVVLTNSNDTCDVKRAFELGANACSSKPLDLERLVALLQALKGCWLWESTPQTYFSLIPQRHTPPRLLAMP